MGSNKSTNDKKTQNSSTKSQNSSNGQNSSSGQNSSKAQVKIVIIRSCHKCGVFDTPLWRTGPDGPKTLCNACGLRYKKEVSQVDTTLSLGSLNNKFPPKPQTTANN